MLENLRSAAAEHSTNKEHNIKCSNAFSSYMHPQLLPLLIWKEPGLAQPL
jgi:hypothetical protein